MKKSTSEKLIVIFLLAGVAMVLAGMFLIGVNLGLGHHTDHVIYDTVITVFWLAAVAVVGAAYVEDKKLKHGHDLMDRFVRDFKTAATPENKTTIKSVAVPVKDVDAEFKRRSEAGKKAALTRKLKHRSIVAKAKTKTTR